MDEAKMKALKAQIEVSLSAESDDSDKYARMAESAPPEYAAILMDISKEEKTHRKHLSDILQDIQKHMAHHDADADEES